MGFHTREGFHSVFSSVTADRNTDRLSFTQTVPSEAVGGAADEIGGGWCYYNDLCFTGEANVIKSVARAENLGVDRAARYRLERYRTDELARAASHYYINLSARLCKQTRQPH